ncbi:Putative Lactoylglutathione lyase [Candidatus Methylacidithermus pantelleriae]|uniref:Lactoylglutathione lyase n=2 Tax=Candidatus Methylacidithermus pantelleriae TaxID=2744239 RepID=A0A8J2FRT7_9BACT|nr:Putative Lactoylglutathione lyase [Candidatus Methylacidithermus pantelleriae]
MVLKRRSELKVLEIAFSAYPVTDLPRARRFYEGILALEPARLFGTETQGFVEYDIGGSTLGIGNGVEGWEPSPNGGCVALEVEDFPAMVEHLRTSGVPFRVEPVETPVCWLAVISDPDGNSLLIHCLKRSS